MTEKEAKKLNKRLMDATKNGKNDKRANNFMTNLIVKGFMSAAFSLALPGANVVLPGKGVSAVMKNTKNIAVKGAKTLPKEMAKEGLKETLTEDEKNQDTQSPVESLASDLGENVVADTATEAATEAATSLFVRGARGMKR